MVRLQTLRLTFLQVLQLVLKAGQVGLRTDLLVASDMEPAVLPLGLAVTWEVVLVLKSAVVEEVVSAILLSMVELLLAKDS
jgi:hypothetical protein